MLVIIKHLIFGEHFVIYEAFSHVTSIINMLVELLTEFHLLKPSAVPADVHFNLSCCHSCI